MNLLTVWRRRSLQRDLNSILARKEQEERIHQGNVAEMDRRIRRLEHQLYGLSGLRQEGNASAGLVWTSD